MIERIEGLKENIVGFKFAGQVTEKEYEEVIFPAIKDQLTKQAKLRILCYFAEDTKVSMGAMWDDTVMGFKHYFDWERIAVVTDLVWIKHSFKALGFLIKGHLKIYPADELQQAIEWLEER